MTERRYDRYGEFRLMARADGYVMARRPGRAPFVMSDSDWLGLPTTQDAAVAIDLAEYRRRIGAPPYGYADKRDG